MGQELIRKVYLGSQGGMNDSVMPDEMSDQEMKLARNIELADKIGWVTARGSKKLIDSMGSSGQTYLCVFEWLCHGVERLVISEYTATKNVIKRIDRATGSKTTLCDGGGDATFFTLTDILYIIVDGKIYEVGQHDYESSGTTSQAVALGEIVLNNEVTQPSGRQGKFYKCKVAGTKNLATEDYSNATNWDDVTDILYTTSTVVREMAAATKDALGNPVTDNDISPIKKCTMIVQHSTSRRFFAAGNPENPLALYISEPDMPNYWKKSGILFPTHPEKKIHALKQFSEEIVVSYRNIWYRWNGLDFDDMIWKPMNLSHGAVSNKAVIMTEYSMTYWSVQGIKIVSASILNSEIVMLQGERVVFDVSNERVEKSIASAVDTSKVRVVYFEGKVLFAYPTDADHPEELNAILSLTFDKKAFTLHDRWIVRDLVVSINGELILACQNYLVKGFEGRSDLDVVTGNPKAIPWRVVTKSYNLGAAMTTKDLYFIYLLFKQFDDEEPATLDLKVRYDSNEVFGIVEYDAMDAVEYFLWGSEWGGVYGYTDYLERMIEAKEFCSTVTLDLSGECLDNSVGLYAVGFEYSLLPLKSLIHRKAGDL